MPEWMDQFLQDEALRREVTPSALIRLAVKRTFFLGSDDKVFVERGTNTPTEAE